MKKKGGRVQIGVYISAELDERLRIVAEERGMTISGLVSQAISQYLDGEDTSELPDDLIRAIEKWYRDNNIGNGSR